MISDRHIILYNICIEIQDMRLIELKYIKAEVGIQALSLVLEEK
jgi:hypothetical protein